jgi:putative transposase
VLTDTRGNLLRGQTRPGDEGERAGGRRVLKGIRAVFPSLRKVFIDQGYEGEDFAAEVQAETGVTLEVVAKPPGQVGFAVHPKRWVVERTIAWLGRCRRLSKDYEHDLASSDAFLHLASIQRLLRKLAPSRDQLYHKPAPNGIQLALL